MSDPTPDPELDIVAEHELTLLPRDIAAGTGGDVFVLSSSENGWCLAAHDQSLAPLWERKFGPRTLGLYQDPKGVMWVLDRGGASAVNGRGEVDRAVSFSPPDGMEVAACTRIGDDMFFACQHTGDAAACEPLLARVDVDGHPRWIETLHCEQIDFQRGAKVGAGSPWKPDEWICGYLESGTIAVSGDALFVRYAEMPRSGFGTGYAVDMATGRVCFTTAMSFHDQVTALGDGSFLVGRGDETVLFDRTGGVVRYWPTRGLHVVDPSGIRLLEAANVLPSKARIVRLEADGSVVRGDLLDGTATPYPHVMDDGTVLFVGNGLLTAVRDVRIVDRCFVDDPEVRDGFATRIVPVPGGFVTTYSRYLRDDGDDAPDPVRHRSLLIKFQL